MLCYLRAGTVCLFPFVPLHFILFSIAIAHPDFILLSSDESLNRTSRVISHFDWMCHYWHSRHQAADMAAAIAHSLTRAAVCIVVG
jgi:hypothetical protein